MGLVGIKSDDYKWSYWSRSESQGRSCPYSRSFTHCLCVSCFNATSTLLHSRVVSSEKYSLKIFFHLCLKTLNYLFFIGKNPKKLIEESVAVVRAIVNVRTTFRSILSDPVLGLLNKSQTVGLPCSELICLVV